MSDVLIRGMEMPKEPDEMIEIAIFGDGKVIQTGESWRNLENGKCYYTTTTPEKFFNAVPVPPHGRLIDADALAREFEEAERLMDEHGLEFSCSFLSNSQEIATEWYCVQDMLENAPTVLPAEEDET